MFESKLTQSQKETWIGRLTTTEFPQGKSFHNKCANYYVLNDGTEDEISKSLRLLETVQLLTPALFKKIYRMNDCEGKSLAEIADWIKKNVSVKT